MDSNKTKHHACEDGLGGVGGTVKTGRVRYQSEGIFCTAVAQAVLLFGSENWVILAAMDRKGFLNQITGKARKKKSRRNTGDTQGGSSVGTGGNSV